MPARVCVCIRASILKNKTTDFVNFLGVQAIFSEVVYTSIQQDPAIGGGGFR